MIAMGAPLKTVANAYRFYIGEMWIFGATSFIIACRKVYLAGMYVTLQKTDANGAIFEEKELSLVSTLFIGSVLYQMAPIFMRPGDFLYKMSAYTIGGILFYFFSVPYGIMFTIYSFTNLHDVSWGNRPSSGTIDETTALR